MKACGLGKRSRGSCEVSIVPNIRRNNNVIYGINASVLAYTGSARDPQLFVNRQLAHREMSNLLKGIVVVCGRITAHPSLAPILAPSLCLPMADRVSSQWRPTCRSPQKSPLAALLSEKAWVDRRPAHRNSPTQAAPRLMVLL